MKLSDNGLSGTKRMFNLVVVLVLSQAVKKHGPLGKLDVCL